MAIYHQHSIVSVWIYLMHSIYFNVLVSSRLSQKGMLRTATNYKLNMPTYMKRQLSFFHDLLLVPNVNASSLNIKEHNKIKRPSVILFFSFSFSRRVRNDGSEWNDRFVLVLVFLLPSSLPSFIGFPQYVTRPLLVPLCFFFLLFTYSTEK